MLNHYAIIFCLKILKNNILNKILIHNKRLLGGYEKYCNLHQVHSKSKYCNLHQVHSKSKYYNLHQVHTVKIL